MKARCYNENNNRYSSYGARGIEICPEWLESNGFINFVDWAMKNGYRDDLTIDRIDTDKNYEPNNCRWSTYKVQENNKTVNRIIECNGVGHTLGEWSEITGLKLSTIWARLDKGWSNEDAILTPKKINQYC
jgi:hypothetical protein